MLISIRSSYNYHPLYPIRLLKDIKEEIVKSLARLNILLVLASIYTPSIC